MEVVTAVIIMTMWASGLLFASHQSGKLVDILKKGKDIDAK